MYQKVDKLDDDQLVPVPLDLSKLSDVIKNKVIKKTVDDELVKKMISLILMDLLKKKIMILQSMILKVTYLVLLA